MHASTAALSTKTVRQLCVCAVSLLLAASAYAQDTSPRVRSDVYPLDGVAKTDGTTFIVDRNLPGIWKRANNETSLFVQGDTHFRKPLNAVRCIALSPDGKLLVGDSATREVYSIDDTGKATALTNGLIGVPVDIACDTDGTIYVSDLERRAVWKWKLDSNEKPSVAIEKANARGLAVDSQKRLWVLSQNEEQLLRYDTIDKPTVIVSKRVFEFGHNVIVDDDGTAWVSDGYAKAVWKVAPDAQPVKAITSESFRNPVGLYMQGDKIMIVDPHAATVFAASRDGNVTEAFKIAKPVK